MFGMGGLAGALELDLLLKAQDEATGVFQSVAAAMEQVIGTTASWQTTLTQVQNNTTMTAADVDTMRAAVLNLSSQSGAPLDQLAAGFMHITNVGFNAADAVKILTEANKSAVSTGAQTADVANVLGLQMHEFGIGAEHAGGAMNVLHLAAAMGNATLQQFVTETSKSTAMAANLGIPITQVDAALAALSRHMDLSQANTALAGEFSKLVNPAAATVKELQHLSDVTGIDLVKDFTQAGMQARTFPGVMDDLRRATGGNVTEMLRLIPAMRGGLAEMVLLGTGSADYTKTLQALTDTYAGRTIPTQDAYTRTMATFNQQIAVVQQSWNQFLMDIGQPILDTLSPYLQQLIGWMNTHKKDVEDFGHAIGTVVGTDIKNFVAGVPGMFAAVSGEVDKFTALTDSIGGFFDSLGTKIHETLRSIASGLFGMSAGFMSVSAQMFNPMLDAMDKALRGLYTWSKGAVGEPMSVSIGRITDPSMDQYALAAQRDAFLASIFGTPNVSRGGGGLAPGDRFVGGGLTGAQMDLANFVGGPWASGGGTSGGGGGSGGGRGRTTPTGLSAGTTGYLDYQQQQAADAARLKALQLTLHEAQDQFSIDMMRNRARLQDAGVQRTLIADIGVIVKDMLPAALGFSPNDREVQRLTLLQQIAGHTATTAAHLGVATGQATNPLLGYRLPQEASFGGSVISFTSMREVSDREQLRQLTAANAALQQQNADLQRQITLLEEGNTHQAATAQATARIASSVGRTPTSMSSILRAHGTALATR